MSQATPTSCETSKLTSFRRKHPDLYQFNRSDGRVMKNSALIVALALSAFSLPPPCSGNSENCPVDFPPPGTTYVIVGLRNKTLFTLGYIHACAVNLWVTTTLSLRATAKRPKGVLPPFLMPLSCQAVPGTSRMSNHSRVSEP